MSLSAPVRDEMVRTGLADDVRYIAAHEKDPRNETVLYEAADTIEALTASQVEAGEVVTDAMIEAGLKAHDEPIIADTRDEMNRKWFTAIYKAMRAAQSRKEQP